jgi:hypothetical protein
MFQAKIHHSRLSPKDKNDNGRFDASVDSGVITMADVFRSAKSKLQAIFRFVRLIYFVE